MHGAGGNQRQLLRAAALVLIGAIVVGLIAPLRAKPLPSALTGAKPGEWPMFGGGPQRNMVNLIDKNLPLTWSAEPGNQKNIKWVADLGSRTALLGQPVIAEGKIFIGTTNHKPIGPGQGSKAVLLALRASDGQPLWRNAHDYPNSGISSDIVPLGLLSSPAAAHGCVYYVTPGCEVICAQTQDGRVLWRLDMMRELAVVPSHCNICSPLVVGDLVFVVTGNGAGDDGKVRAPQAPSFVALNRTTGKLVWQSNLPGANIIEGQWSNPAFARVGDQDQVIFPGGDAWLYGFEVATGKPIWKFNCQPERAARDAGGPVSNYIVATPVVHDNKVYVGLGTQPDGSNVLPFSHILCVDITKTGDVSPKTLDHPDPRNEGTALVWSYGGRIVPTPKKGRRAVFGRTISTAAVNDGLVYVSEESGYLHCLDARTGQRYWVEDFKAGVWGSPYWVDGRVYLGADDGDLWVFAHGKQKLAPARIEMDESIHSTPAAAHGVLYVMTRSKLYAIGR